MNTITRQNIVLAAGGTGGHLFPAQALAEVLQARGFAIHLMTDERMHDYGKDFPAEKIHIVPSATLSLSDPLRLPLRLARLAKGCFSARATLKQLRPAAVIGFGGYPSLPPMLAAVHLRLPSIVHEQNSVLGRANRLMASRVTAVATSFPKLVNLPTGIPCHFTGNPVRAVVRKLAGQAYPVLPPEGPINLLVFGGSQGARVFADLVPPTIAALPEVLRKRLLLSQQCRTEDLDRTRAAYRAAGVAAELEPFFADMPQRMAKAHLVICRSGASSVAELGVIGRPAILVPLPHAIDNDQLRNAESFAAAGAGWLQEQKDLEPAAFASFLTRLLSNEQGLKEAALAARGQGKPDAAEALADLVEQIMVAHSQAETKTT